MGYTYIMSIFRVDLTLFLDFGCKVTKKFLYLHLISFLIKIKD